MKEWVRVCFSFPFLLPGWSVDVRNGQYRATLRGMVRAGGSASRTIGDRGTTDPGGGVVGSRRRQPAWQLPVGRGLGPHWTSNEHAFPPLGSYSTKVAGPH